MAERTGEMKASEVSISELKTQVASLVVDNKTLGEDVDAANHKAATLEKEIAAARSAKALESVSSLVKKGKKIGDFTLVIDKLEDEILVDDLRTIAVNLRSKVESSIVVLSTLNLGKPLLVAAVSADAVKRGVKAGELIKVGSAVLGGGGGGKDDFAQGGGVDSSLIPQAFSEITKLLTEKLN
ncbi:MAG: hypothetical protein RLZZ154_580 [Actinomycetota bacterium]